MKHLPKILGVLLLLGVFAVPALADDDELIILTANRDQVVKKLMTELSDCNNPNQVDAAFTLGEGKVEEAIDPLITMLKTGEEKCRIVAALALTRIGNEKAKNAVLEAANTDSSAKVRKLAGWFYEQYASPVAAATEVQP